MRLTHTFDDGKYTVIYDGGKLSALRYGEPWRDMTGDKLVSSMLFEVDRLKDETAMVVTRITCAYEQGYGHAHRAEISNPYEPGTHEAEAWNQGREIGLSRPAPWNPPALSTLQDGDVATIVGVKDGVETVLGRMPLQPAMKAKDILRSYGLENFDDEDSDASYALIAIEDLVRWMRSVGWREPPMELAEKGAGA